MACCLLSASTDSVLKKFVVHECLFNLSDIHAAGLSVNFFGQATISTCTVESVQCAVSLNCFIQC